MVTLTDSGKPTVDVRDHALWLAHIRGDVSLASRLALLKAGETVELKVDGVVGTWCKMADGVDGRSSPGLRPVSTEAKEKWHALQADRGRSVTINAMDAKQDVASSAKSGQTANGGQMSFIVKCKPVARSGEGVLIVHAPPYEGAQPSKDQTVYVWFSETDGGQGLAEKGVIEAIGDGSPLPLVVRPNARLAKGLRKADLAPYRDVTEVSPLAGLARKLFKHALNKVTELSADEAAYLEQRFVPLQVSALSSDGPALEAFIALENLPGDGRKMFADTAWYRLTTVSEHADAEKERQVGTTRGFAAEFIRSSGGKVMGRALHYHMLKNGPGKWDSGYVHSKRAKDRGWICEI